MKFIDAIQSKIELFRLEQRYTRRRERRSTFVSDATYVDGEYIYNTDAIATKPSQHTGGSSTSEASKTSTLTNSSTNNSLGRREARMQRKRGNSLIMEVNAELERAEREGSMDVQDLVGRGQMYSPSTPPISPVIEEIIEPVESSRFERKRTMKNRLSRISIRELKWDTAKGQ